MVQAEISSPFTYTPQRLAAYRSLFVGRADDFAIQQPNGRYLRAGRPLTDRALHKHLTFQHTIGTYIMDRNGLCSFAVFDADSDDGLSQLRGVQMRLANDGVSSLLELSRRPGHLWVFLQKPVLASRLREWLLPYCPEEVEFYPKQNEGVGYGSLIRLPLGVHQRTGRCYPFVRYDEHATRFVSLAPTVYSTIDVLATLVERADVPHLVHDVQAEETRQTVTPPSLTKTPFVCLPYSTNTIHAWCAVQDPFQVIRRYLILQPNKTACCPFGEHHRNGKDTHSSFKVYSPKRVGGACWYCYTAQEGGNVFNFLCRWYGVDAREMWRRIQTGELL